MSNIVNPAMVTLARESRGLTQKQLADAVDVTQGNISKVEHGTLSVSDELLGGIASALEYPKKFFLQSEDIYGPGIAFVYHRSRKTLSKKIIARIESLINIHRIVISRLLKSVEIDINYTCYDPDEADIKDIAQAVRAMWFLPRGPIKNLTETIEKAGGIIIKCDFGTPKIDALSQNIPGLPPLFFINKNIPTDRLRFSLAHELGHVIMHRIPNPEFDIEEQADRFAGEFLMPADEIGASLHNLTLPKLAQLKPYWKTSMASLIMHATVLGRITKSKASYLWMQLNKLGYKTREPVELDLPPEEPSLLKRLIDIYINELEYSVDELSNVANLLVREFKENYLGEERHLKLIRLNR